MRIGRMAVDALAVRDRLLEVSSLVAIHALDFEMFPEQRKTCLRVVECFGEW